MASIWTFVGGAWHSFINIPNLNVCETRLYFEFTATNRIPANNFWVKIFEPEVGYF